MKLYAMLTILLVTLSACGGGGSSSASSGGSGGASGFDGVYTGSSETVATTLGQTVSVTGPITVTIENGNVIYLDENNQRFEVPIGSDGRFSASNTDFGTIGGSIESCQGTAVLNGVATPPTVTGTIEGSGSCVVEGQTQNIVYTNTFNASL